MKKIFVLVIMLIMLMSPGKLNSYARVIPEMPERYSLHQVREGETLWGISQKYVRRINPVLGVKWIKKVNKMPSGYIIQPGDLLSVPDYKGGLNTAYVKKQSPKVSQVFARNIRRQASRSEESFLMEATAYCSCKKCCGKDDGITATGTKAHQGTLAVDPDVIPLGSRVYIEGFGWYKAEDTGRLIKGHRIDIWFSSHSEAIEFGRKKVLVRVADKAEI